MNESNVSPSPRSSYESSDERKAKILEGMEEHLVERYGEFEHESYDVQLSGFPYPYDICNMYIQVGETEDERNEFAVYRYYDSENDSYYYTDNYYWHIIKDEYESEMCQELSELFSSCKVYLGTNSLSYEVPDEINGETTLEQAKEIGLPKHMFWIVVEPSLFDEESFSQLDDEIKAKWGDLRPKPILRIFLPESDSIYNGIYRYNVYDYYGNYIAEIGN